MARRGPEHILIGYIVPDGALPKTIVNHISSQHSPAIQVHQKVIIAREENCDLD